MYFPLRLALVALLTGASALSAQKNRLAVVPRVGETVRVSTPEQGPKITGRDFGVRVSGRVLEEGDCVCFDFGGVVDGYCSDFGRTVVCGEGTTPKTPSNLAKVSEN